MKIVINALLVIAALIGCLWLYNHFNPWLGIVLFILVLAYVVQLIIKRLK